MTIFAAAFGAMCLYLIWQSVRKGPAPGDYLCLGLVALVTAFAAWLAVSGR